MPERTYLSTMENPMTARGTKGMKFKDRISLPTYAPMRTVPSSRHGENGQSDEPTLLQGKGLLGQVILADQCIPLQRHLHYYRRCRARSTLYSSDIANSGHTRTM